MDYRLPVVPFILSMFVGMLICHELGRRLGRSISTSNLQQAPRGLATVEGAVFALYGLLLAFTFSGAAARFDERRRLIQQEANAIGTAYLRLDLLPPEARAAMREQFRTYLDSRITVYEKLPDIEAAEAELVRSNQIQHGIWSGAVVADRQPGADPDAAKLLLPALNDLINITSTRTMAARTHPPPIIYGLLLLLSLVCSLLAGFGMGQSARRHWLHIAAFVAFAVITTYVILDVEYPRGGFIRVSKYDQVLVELRQSMQ